MRFARVVAITCILVLVSPALAADFDGDSDVDQADFGFMQKCCAGQGVASAPACENADFDLDGDVDQDDITIFLGYMAGPGIPAAPGCLLPAPEDTILVPPPRVGPLLGTITGYEMDSGCPYGDPAKCEVPILRPYDRDTPQWWDNLVEELMYSRVHVVMMHGRGCYDRWAGLDGNGGMCPRLLVNLVDAINRCDGARNVLRLGMFDDTGAYQGARNHIEGLPSGTLFDLSNPSTWVYFWDYNMRIWFDTVPSDLWYRLDGRPVVAFWGPVGMSNAQGNASALFSYLRTNFINRYGEDPHFNVTSDWRQVDSTLTTQHVQALEGWFNPRQSTYTYTSWNGAYWGCAVPGFRDPNYLPGCGTACREQLRNDGAALRNGLANTAGKGARFTLLEGWTDIAESAGYYRSGAWRYPNQYLNVVREFSDPQTDTLRFQAEAADACFDTTSGNQGGAYRDGDLDIDRLSGPGGNGWYVGWTEPGEWIQFSEVFLACGTYRFTARLSGSPGRRLHLEIDGQSLGSVDLVRGGASDAWQLVRLGSCALRAGRHHLRLVFDTGGTSADWFFSRKVACAGLGCNAVHLRAGNGQYLTARNGGGGLVRADGQTTGAYESFTLIDQDGGALLSGDPVNLMTWNARHYLQADDGGGASVSADATQAGNYQRFTIIRIAGSGPISNGEAVALRAYKGQYVVAENGGGGVVNANRTAIGPWETFTFSTCE